MSEKKAARILTLVVVLCLIVGMAPAVSAAGVTGFQLDTSDNVNFDAYWKAYGSVYSVFNSADSGFFLTGWCKRGGYVGIGLTQSSTYGYPVLTGGGGKYTTQGTIGSYTTGSYPLGTLTGVNYGYYAATPVVFRNYAEAKSYFDTAGVQVYFLTPDSYLQCASTSKSTTTYVGKLCELGVMNTDGSVTYGYARSLYYISSAQHSGTTGYYFLGAYAEISTPTPDEVALLPDGFTVAAGVAKGVPFWLSDGDGNYYNNPSVTWSMQAYDPNGAAQDVAWAAIGATSGVLNLTADSVPGYDIEVTASWGDGYSKTTTLFVRDLGDPGGSDPEIPETGVVERAEFLALQEDVQALQEQVDEMPDRIAESMEQVLDQEKDEADQGGNENVGDLTGAIPDYSAGFMDALREFASSMIYSGTDAVLSIPAIVFPEIGGLVPSFTLLEANSLDFGQVFQIVPDTVMRLVQALLTIALIVYCFKELYGTISYVLTLRGGGA